MNRVDALRISSVAVASLAVGLSEIQEAWAGSSSRPADLRIYGGQEVKTCEFPTAAGGTKKCTATLIHPSVVISAGHCGPLKKVFFGEYRQKPAFTMSTKWCELTSVQSTDAQICVLEKAVRGVPVAPIIQGCESDKIKVGAKVLLSGYGLSEDDPANAGDAHKNEKRWVETEIVAVKSDALHIGKDGKGGCNGDSGGPAYLQMDDGSWRTIGATHRGADGAAHPKCNVGIWKRSDTLLKWYEEQLQKHDEKDIDLSPCFDDAGQWAPTQECGGYTKDVKGPYGAWDNNCGQGVPSIKYSATCGPAFKEQGKPGEDSKKDPVPGPSIEFLKPKDGASFRYGQTIEVEVKISGEEKIKEATLFIDGDDPHKLSHGPYIWKLKSIGDGQKQLEVRATDNKGQSKRKSVTIVINPEGEPTVDSPQDPDTKKDTPSDPGSTGGSTGSQPAEDGKKQEAGPEGPESNKAGCSLAEGQPTRQSWLWALGFALLFWKERSSRK